MHNTITFHVTRLCYMLLANLRFMDYKHNISMFKEIEMTFLPSATRKHSQVAYFGAVPTPLLGQIAKEVTTN